MIRISSQSRSSAAKRRTSSRIAERTRRRAAASRNAVRTASESVNPSPRAADAAGMWVFIPLGGFALGVLVGRWWTVAVAVPFGVYIAASNDLEGHLGVWVASMLSVLLALAIAAGVVLHRLQRRGRRLRA